MEKVKVSFDFDCTLDRKCMQDYAALAMSKGVEAWIVTSRLDDKTYSLKYFTSLDIGILANADLYEVSSNLGIPRDRVVFTNGEYKWHFFKANPGFAWHIDDDWMENNYIIRYAKTPSINSWGNSSWSTKCTRILRKHGVDI